MYLKVSARFETVMLTWMACGVDISRKGNSLALSHTDSDFRMDTTTQCCLEAHCFRLKNMKYLMADPILNQKRELSGRLGVHALVLLESPDNKSLAGKQYGS